MKPQSSQHRHFRYFVHSTVFKFARRHMDIRVRREVEHRVWTVVQEQQVGVILESVRRHLRITNVDR